MDALEAPEEPTASPDAPGPAAPPKELDEGAADGPEAQIPPDGQQLNHFASPSNFPPPGKLYTQCPNCQTVYRFTVAQLRSGQGEALCLHCQARFNALAALAETAVRARPGADPTSQLPALGRLDAVAAPAPVDHESFPENSPPPDTAAPLAAFQWRWAAGSLALLVLLAAQWVWHEGPGLAQNERLRPSLDAICQILGCRLPPFRALAALQIVEQDLHPVEGRADAYEFVLVLANQAALPQAFPAIRLVLDARDGGPAAARVFQPEDYLPAPALMPPGELKEIRLLLAKPQSEFGGFSFELQ